MKMLLILFILVIPNIAISDSIYGAASRGDYEKVGDYLTGDGIFTIKSTKRDVLSGLRSAMNNCGRSYSYNMKGGRIPSNVVKKRLNDDKKVMSLFTAFLEYRMELKKEYFKEMTKLRNSHYRFENERFIACKYVDWFRDYINTLSFDEIIQTYKENVVTEREIIDSIHYAEFEKYMGTLSGKQFSKLKDCFNMIESSSRFSLDLIKSNRMSILVLMCSIRNKSDLARTINHGCFIPNYTQGEEYVTLLFQYIKKFFEGDILNSVHNVIGNSEKLYHFDGYKSQTQYCSVLDNDIVRLLMKQNANPNIKDVYGNTVISYLNEKKDDCYAFGTICPYKDKAKKLLRILLSVE